MNATPLSGPADRNGLKKILLWLRIVRPQTLFASLIPVLVGWLVAHRSGLPAKAFLPAFNTDFYPLLTGIVTVFCALSLQILSNLINDYYDYLRGTDKAGRAGFKRALAEGEVTQRQMRTACLTALGCALLSGAYLVLAGGWPILLIGISAILFAWLYTATSHSLSYLGIADLFVFLYYGVVASAGTFWLQTQVFSVAAFHAGAVCGLISMCVLMINNLRDMEGDRLAGKKTLPVRIGKRAAEGMMLAEVLLMPFFAYLAFGWSPAMLVGIAGLGLFAAVRKAQGTGYNRCLLATGLVNLLYFLLCLVS